jgi:hypothetical protein
MKEKKKNPHVPAWVSLVVIWIARILSGNQLLHVQKLTFLCPFFKNTCPVFSSPVRQSKNPVLPLTNIGPDLD